MNKMFNKWKSRLSRLQSNPKHFFKEAYYFKLSSSGRKRKHQPYKVFFNEITTFTSKYNVNTLKINDEYIWPYIRNHIWIHICSVALGKSNRKYLNPIAIQNAHYKQVPINTRLNLKYTCNAYEIDEIDETKLDFLFFINTNGTEEVWIHDKIYHRIIDPIYEVAQEIGKSEKVEIVKSNNMNIFKWKKYIHKSKIIFLEYVIPDKFTLNKSYDEDFFSKIKKYVPSIVLTDHKHLEEVISYELHIKNQYIKLLKKLNPKVICLHGFHYQAPLISAADALGILTVDLQHGIQVGWNPLYNVHTELPPSGYQAYPDYFAVWGHKEYENILKVFNSDKHKPILMGNPWLKKIEDFSVQLSEKIVERIRNYEVSILIIMQNQTAIPKLFLDIIEQSSDNILWIIRHHPKGEKYNPQDFSKSKNILIDEDIDNILFNELFKHIDIAISEGSTLAMEANNFGINNIIIGETGKDNYKEEINNGTFFYLKDTNDFNIIFKKIIASAKEPKAKLIENIDTKYFLKSLLVKAKDKQETFQKNIKKK